VVRNAQPVAIKVLKSEIVGQSRFEARFENEVLVTSRIQHPNVVEVLDHGYLDDGRLFLVLELLTGRSLGEVMLASDVIEWKRALRITREVALALGAVHSEGIVHRDVKPENIFLLPKVGSEMVKLMDFGLAKTLVVHDDDDEEAEHTQPGFAIGTPTYMAPERVTGDYDYRSDLYGLAVVTYQMLVGRPPFEGEPTDILKAHLTKAPMPPSEANPGAGVPPSVEALLAKALAKDMNARYQTYLELIDAIDQILDSEYDQTVFSDAAPELTMLDRMREFLAPVLQGTKQTRQIAALVGALVVVGMISIIVLASSGDAKEEAAASEALASGAATRVESAKVAQQVDRSQEKASDPVIARLAEIELSLAKMGFVPNEGATITMLHGARLCDEGRVDALGLTVCIYDSAAEAQQARATVEASVSLATSVVIAKQDALVWIVDEAAADPEGRRIQRLIDAID
jgi:hypothetical protein